MRILPSFVDVVSLVAASEDGDSQWRPFGREHLLSVRINGSALGRTDA